MEFETVAPLWELNTPLYMRAITGIQRLFCVFFINEPIQHKTDAQHRLGLHRRRTCCRAHIQVVGVPVTDYGCGADLSTNDT